LIENGYDHKQETDFDLQLHHHFNGSTAHRTDSIEEVKLQPMPQKPRVYKLTKPIKKASPKMEKSSKQGKKQST
jgi:hypothetical protein